MLTIDIFHLPPDKVFCDMRVNTDISVEGLAIANIINKTKTNTHDIAITKLMILEI